MSDVLFGMVGRRSKTSGSTAAPPRGGAARCGLPARCHGPRHKKLARHDAAGHRRGRSHDRLSERRRPGECKLVRALAKDAESKDMGFPAEYMFRDVPDHVGTHQDPVALTLAAMDRHGINIGLVGLRNPATAEALHRHPERFVAGLEVDPNDIGGAVRTIHEAHATSGIVAVTTSPPAATRRCR